MLVGDDVPSERYVALKHEDCAAIGMYSVGEHLPATATQREVIDVIKRYNADPKVSAFLVQLPLPAGLDEEQALLAVDPAKDVDGLHPVNLGRLVLGTPGQLPCTPAGIVELLHAYDVPVEGRHAVIIGRGVTIGRPLAMLLSLKRPGCNAAVTVLHTGVERARHGRHRAHGGHRRGRRRATRPGDPGHGQARRRRGVGGHELEGSKLIPDVREDVAEVAGLDHAPPRRCGSHDPCHAVAQRVAGGGAGGEVTHGQG